MKTKTKLIVITVVSVLIIGAVAWRFVIKDAFVSSDEYAPDQFEVLSEGFTDDGIELVIKVQGESLYYSPGATFKKSNGTINFSVVRAHVDTKPIVDVIAERRADGSLVLLFPLDNKDLSGGRKVELKDSSGHLLGAWNIAE